MFIGRSRQTIVQNTLPLNRNVLGVGRWACAFSAQVLPIELKTAMAKQTNYLENVQFANPEAMLPPFVIKQKRV